VKVSSLSFSDFRAQIKNEGAFLETGPFTVHIRSSLRDVAEGIYRLYGQHPLAESNDFADFHITLDRPSGTRRWLRPQVVFSFDGHNPFKPLPLLQAFPMFEWTYNWCIANHSNQYLILHAACIEKNGRVAILPGPPGAGKSTLCATLVNNGWRLLSDELSLIDIFSGKMYGLARPVNLKNESINIIRRNFPEAVMGRATSDTVKGTVAHMKAPDDSIERVMEPADARWIIFPKYKAGTNAEIKPRSKACTFIYAAENSFNYSNLGNTGFEVLEKMINHVECFDFSYSSLDEAVSVFNTL